MGRSRKPYPTEKAVFVKEETSPALSVTARQLSPEEINQLPDQLENPEAFGALYAGWDSMWIADKPILMREDFYDSNNNLRTLAFEAHLQEADDAMVLLREASEENLEALRRKEAEEVNAES